MEDTLFGYRFLLLALIVALNAFFATAEMALVSVRQSRLRELAADGNVGAQAALTLLGKPERLLSTVQVGVTLASLGAGWAGEETVYSALVGLLGPVIPPGFLPALHVVSFGFAFLFLTYVMVVIGEVVPKNLGIKKADRFAVIVAPLLLVFYRFAEPFVYVLEKSSTVISRWLGLRGDERGTHSVEELKVIASSVRASGRLSLFEEETIHRTADLHTIAVREIMVPRNDVVSIPVTAPFERVLTTLAENLHARYPVYEKDPERLLGVLHYKDLLPAWQRVRDAGRTGGRVPFRLRSLLRKLPVVPETKPLSQMIDEFRKNRSHMAMVVDEFGTIVGLVTLEDVLEQIFGEIEDEHDVETPRPSLEAQVLELEGTISIRDLETRYDIDLPTNAGFETLAGFLLYQLGYIPNPGDTVEHDGRRFTILDMDRKRIAKVRIEKVAEELEEPAADIPE